MPRLKKFLSEMGDIVPRSVLLYSEYGHTQSARTEILQILKEVPFTTPKPTRLIGRILQLATNPGDLVLDSFAGSGTTGHAVLELNKEDGGDRRFILVEIEQDIAQTITAERLKRVINGYSWKNGKGEKHKEPGLSGGFRYCSLGPMIFNADGSINPAVKFKDLARHIYFTETREPWPGKHKGPFIGEHAGVSYYLFFNGVGRNGFGRAELGLLPNDSAPKVVYADKSRVGAAALAARGITFKHIPYEIKVE